MDWGLAFELSASGAKMYWATPKGQKAKTNTSMQ